MIGETKLLIIIIPYSLRKKIHEVMSNHQNQVILKMWLYLDAYDFLCFVTVPELMLLTYDSSFQNNAYWFSWFIQS